MTDCLPFLVSCQLEFHGGSAFKHRIMVGDGRLPKLGYGTTEKNSPHLLPGNRRRELAA